MNYESGGSDRILIRLFLKNGSGSEIFSNSGSATLVQPPDKEIYDRKQTQQLLENLN